MIARDVEIGAIYVASVSGQLVEVTILHCGDPRHGAHSESGRGWLARNTSTGRTVRILTAARLRQRVYSDVERAALAADRHFVNPALNGALRVFRPMAIMGARRGARLVQVS